MLVSKQADFYSEPFDGRGVRCCDVDSPVIFNIVVDAIIRDVEACRLKELATTTQNFCANNRVIADNEPKKVWTLVCDCKEPSARGVGLKMNDKKRTKGMAIDGAKPPTMMSQEAFDQKRGIGQCRTLREKAEARVQQCKLCGVMCVTETGACEAPAGGSVQEGQRRMGNKPR
jgi:hypothetical protein